MTYCKLVNEYIRQDILCLRCRQCELNLKQIEIHNQNVSKYMEGKK